MTVVVLALLVGTFVVLGFTQGPKLSSAQIDVGGVVAQSGQQLRLFANQAVATVDAEQVTVTPDAAATVSTSGDVIAVQFDEPLNYGTRYTVEVRDVTSVYVDHPATFNYTFETGSPAIHYLDRASAGSDADDEIIATRILDTDRTVLFAAPRIQDYAEFDTATAVVTLGDDDLSELSLVNSQGNVEPLTLPGDGIIENLHASQTGVLGFTFTSAGPTPEREFSDTLFSVDLNNSRIIQPVAGIDGNPMQVLDWEFIPVTGEIIAQSLDQSLFRLDPAVPGVILPLGQYLEFGTIASDGSAITVADPFGQVALSLVDGSIERLEASPLDGLLPSGGAVQVLPSGDRIQRVAIFDSESGRFRSELVYDDGTQSRELFGTIDDAGSIESFTVSPNSEYVAVETVPNVAASVSDGYPVGARSTTVTTVFVEIATGAVIKSVEGFRPTW